MLASYMSAGLCLELQGSNLMILDLTCSCLLPTYPPGVILPLIFRPLHVSLNRHFLGYILDKNKSDKGLTKTKQYTFPKAFKNLDKQRLSNLSIIGEI